MRLDEAKEILEENGFLLEEEDPQKSLLDSFEAVCVNYPNANVGFGTDWAGDKQQIYINIYSNGEANSIYIEPQGIFFETVGEIVDACEEWQSTSSTSNNANKETGKFVNYLKALPQKIKDRG